MVASLQIRAARARADYDACVRLQREVWGLSDLEITSAIQLIATVHAGGLLLVAEAPGDGIVGFSYGFAGWSDGAPHLHSDMLAVRPSWRGKGVGLRLKWAQRDGALARGLRLVTWTFDPMRAKNARLNLRRLGRSRASSCRTSTAARARSCTTASPPTACSPAGSSRARASSASRRARPPRPPTGAPRASTTCGCRPACR